MKQTNRQTNKSRTSRHTLKQFEGLNRMSEVPLVIVRNLPNGSPCISARHHNKQYSVDECHDVLLANHEYNHNKINDIFFNCLSLAISTNGPSVVETSTPKLKHCSISFQKNLNMLEQ